jgi:predicted secreted protein
VDAFGISLVSPSLKDFAGFPMEMTGDDEDFAMGWMSGIAVYLVIWWLVIFMVLPWGNQALDAEDVARGHASGAPRKPHLAIKLAVTTVIAAILWVVVDVVMMQGWISFRS